MASKSLGILLSTGPENKNIFTVVSLAQEAVHQEIDTYLYLIDDGVLTLNHPQMDALKKEGVEIFVCAYGAHRRGLPLNETATFAGLVALSDLILGCDRFITFN